MAIDKTKKAKSINGLSGGKVSLMDSLLGIWSTPDSFPYLTSLTLKPNVRDSESYADDARILLKPSDTGLDGDIGTTAQDVNFETLAGYLVETAAGLGEIKIHGYKPFCFYFEHNRTDPDTGVDYKVKTWVLNAIIGKSESKHETNEESPSTSAYSYPIRVDGINMKSGEAVYLDENGFPVCVYKVSAFPGDANYATFGAAVPTIAPQTP